jgi:hypothetical protein
VSQYRNPPVLRELQNDLPAVHDEFRRSRHFSNYRERW